MRNPKKNKSVQSVNLLPTTKKVLAIHNKKMHKVFTCTKCGGVFDTGREQKIHVYTHSYTSESKMIKCKNCDFQTKSVYTMEVHVARCRTEIFECGLCEETFVEEVRFGNTP